MIDFHVAWLDALDDTLSYGDRSAPRGQEILERLNVSVRFDPLRSLLYHPERKLNYRFAVAEFLWMANGSDLLAPLTRYNSKMAAFSDDGKTLAGAYGPRLRTQWPYVVAKLREDPDSRQAVASIWKPKPSASKDVPCTLSAQFLIRGGKLRSIWTMRSSDLWLGLPYDAFTFARLAACVATCVGVPVGEVAINAGSSHLYKRNFDAARKCLEVPASAYSIRQSALPGFPPHSLLNAAVDGATDARRSYSPPWAIYAAVLRSKTSAEARMRF